MISSWQAGEFCDAELRCGGARHAAHRVVLAACSAPLAQAFSQFGAGRAIDLAPLCGLGDGDGAAESLHLVLEWLYRGEVRVE